MNMFQSDNSNDLKVNFVFVVLILISTSLLWFVWMKESHAMLHAFDTGIYLQLLNGISTNWSWASSITGESNFLAHHFQPIIILFLPLFWLSHKAIMLFSLAAVMFLMGLWFLWREYSNSICPKILGAMLVSFLLHPTISMRIIQNFVPEVVAFPILVLIALLIEKGREHFRIAWTSLVILMITAGLSKETVWPILSFACFLYGLKWRQDRRFAWTLATIWLVAFIYVFRVFMPQHTNMTNYYGLRYYLLENEQLPTSIWQWIHIIFRNLFSYQSAHTFIIAVGVLNFFIPFFGSIYVLLGALPGLAMILIATHDAIHHPGNQYQLLALPFLFVASLSALEKRAFLQNFRVRRWLPVLIALPSLTIYLLPRVLGGLDIVNSMKFAKNIPSDLMTARNEWLADHSKSLIVDANLQPMLYDYPNLRVLLPFVGNPMNLTKEDYKNVDFIVTLADVRSINCRDVKRNDFETTKYDYEAFYSYCEVVQTQVERTITYPDSHLNIHVLKK